MLTIFGVVKIINIQYSKSKVVVIISSIIAKRVLTTVTNKLNKEENGKPFD